MKSALTHALIVAGVLLASAAAANAETLEVKVPFPFVVGSTQMPAGMYRIERDATMPSSVLLIRGEHGSSAQLFVQTTELIGASPAGGPALVFVPDETANRLTQVWSTSAIGQELTARRGKPQRLGQIVVFGERTSL
jgi:hypothetical protein